MHRRGRSITRGKPSAGVLAMALAAAACGDERAAERGDAPLAQSGSARSSPAARRAAQLASGKSSDRAVTLISGDRVTLQQVEGRIMTQIAHGPGRDHLAFAISEREGEITVIPEDLAALVGSGQLDGALFNVTQLLNDGFGDGDRDDLPLILTGTTGAPPALRSSAGRAGVTIDRVLPSLQAVALRQRKGSAGEVLAALTGPATGARAAGAAPVKLWLDRVHQLSLDQSVPQIGGPAAHARGLSGAGVTVAVLDSGIDATHPDLLGKVAAAETFVNDGNGTADRHGHGTHIASTIAGSGAASGGQLRGVAPGATLINGRVCDSAGRCSDSALLAGMEWAVAQGAQIVNLSLGRLDDAGVNPVEQAVNQLSAQHGTLFVVAAGNSGYQPGMVSTPCTADAALCVGAVNRLDQRASFSGQGPRPGDLAIKPDVMAPGVGIVAARAAGTQLGAPVGERYVRLNGTSMATPHVAGAAALLLQQHPGWTGEQLKATLMATAQPNDDRTVYEQGAGRIDLDRATAQVVRAEPGSLSLGSAAFPHDDDLPIVRAVRYHNAGAAPVTLALTASLTAPGGAAAPAAMIAVSPATLTVPAGGSAEAVLTVDTRVAAPDGIYGGSLLATAGAARLRTPIGVEREIETHELTVNVIGAAGQPGEAFVSISGTGAPGSPARGVSYAFVPVAGQATFRVPVGTYVVEALDSLAGTWLLAPRLAVTAATSVAMDARLARGLEPTLPEPGLRLESVVWAFVDLPNEIGTSLLTPSPVSTAQIGPSAAPGEIHSMVISLLAPASGSARRVYHLAHVERDRFLTGWKPTLRNQDLAIVEARHAGAAGRALRKVSAAYPLLAGPIQGMAVPPYDGPFHRTEHYYGPDFKWYVELAEVSVDPEDPRLVTSLASNDTLQEYRAGQRTFERWNRGPLGPAFAGPSLYSYLPGFTGAPQVYAGMLVLQPSMFSDQASPARSGTSWLDEGRVRLYRDGQLVRETSDPYELRLIEPVSQERSQYRLEVDARRSAELFDRSTRVTAAWTFHARSAAATQTLSLPTLRFAPLLDEHNQTSASLLVLPIRIERPVGAARPGIADARVEASFDDGATWTRLPIFRFGDQALGLVVHPRGASHVSLRGSAGDVEGNTVEQTILRAYTLRRD